MVFPYAIDTGRQIVRITLAGTVEGTDIAQTIQTIFADPNFRPEFDQLWDGQQITSLHLDVNDQPQFLEIERRNSPATGSGRDIILVKRDVDYQASLVYAMRVRAGGGPRQVFVVRTEREADQILNDGRSAGDQKR